MESPEEPELPDIGENSDIGEGGDGVLIIPSSEIEESEELRSPSAMACSTQAFVTFKVLVSI